MACQVMSAHNTPSTRHYQRARQPRLFSDLLSPPSHIELHYEVKYTPPREEEVARVETLPTEHMPGDMGEKTKKTKCCELM